jgi:hypothetical protein
MFTIGCLLSPFLLMPPLTLAGMVSSNSRLKQANALDSAGEPREQAKENEIKVYRDLILHIPSEQEKEDEIKV